MKHAIPVLIVTSLSACTWNEDFTHFDLVGTVRLPKEAATFIYDYEGRQVRSFGLPVVAQK